VSDKLQPCPFCGSENVMFRVDDDAGARVWCNACLALGPPFGRMAQESAIAAWNNRQSAHPQKRKRDPR